MTVASARGLTYCINLLLDGERNEGDERERESSHRLTAIGNSEEKYLRAAGLSGVLVELGEGVFEAR